MEDQFDDFCDFVADAMQEPADTAELQIERRADFIIRELDEFCKMATNRETVDLIAREIVVFGQLLTRVQLILSFIDARNPPKLRVVQNNG